MEPSPICGYLIQDGSIVRLLQIDQQPGRILDRVLERDEERHCLTPIDQAVIVGQRQIHHRADHYLPIADHRAVLDAVEAERFWAGLREQTDSFFAAKFGITRRGFGASSAPAGM